MCALLRRAWVFRQVVYDEARLFVFMCKRSWEAGGWESATADGRTDSLSDARVVLACRGGPDACCRLLIQSRHFEF